MGDWGLEDKMLRHLHTEQVRHLGERRRRRHEGDDDDDAASVPDDPEPEPGSRAVRRPAVRRGAAARANGRRRWPSGFQKMQRAEILWNEVDREAKLLGGRVVQAAAAAAS